MNEMIPARLRAKLRRAISAGVFALIAADYVAAEAGSAVQVDAGDPARGKQLSEAERCQGCHGEDGNSTVPFIPKLAGQNVEHIVERLRDFKSGERRLEVMSVMAVDIDDDLIDIAAYFAANSMMQSEGQEDDLLAKR